MEYHSSWNDPLQSYLKPFEELIGDRRTQETFREIVKGIIASGSVIGQQIASHSSLFARRRQCVSRLLHNILEKALHTVGQTGMATPSSVGNASGQTPPTRFARKRQTSTSAG